MKKLKKIFKKWKRKREEEGGGRKWRGTYLLVEIFASHPLKKIVRHLGRCLPTEWRQREQIEKIGIGCVSCLEGGLFNFFCRLCFRKQTNAYLSSTSSRRGVNKDKSCEGNKEHSSQEILRHSKVKSILEIWWYFVVGRSFASTRGRKRCNEHDGLARDWPSVFCYRSIDRNIATVGNGKLNVTLTVKRTVQNSWGYETINTDLSVVR